jgi:hypothetical protein
MIAFFEVSFLSMSVYTGRIDIKPATVQDQFLTDCCHLVFGRRREDTQRILRLMVNSWQFGFHPEPPLVSRNSAVRLSPTVAQFVAAGAISAHFSGAAEPNRSASQSTPALHRIPSTRTCVNSIVSQISAEFAGKRPISHQFFPIQVRIHRRVRDGGAHSKRFLFDFRLNDSIRE